MAADLRYAPFPGIARIFLFLFQGEEGGRGPDEGGSTTGFWWATCLRISLSFALRMAAFSWPMRIMIFWPAERFSSFGSAYS
jgi:hypothetical protein